MIGKTNARGQGSLEYLLIIGGAVAIAAIVIYMVLSSTSTGTEAAQETQRLSAGSSHCEAACADESFCDDGTPADWTRAECANQCKEVLNSETATNAEDCRWDCTSDAAGTGTDCTEAGAIRPGSTATYGAWVPR